MILPLHIFTIVLDGWPFLPMQLHCFNQLKCDWTWHIVEGAARNVRDTGWCKTQYPRLSTDGGHEFIESLKNHPRVHVRWAQDWKGGKVEMCNAAIEHITDPCVLMQVDVDELWQPWQLEKVLALLDNPRISGARFFCRYFLGPNIITIGEDCYGNNQGEWARAWRFNPAMEPFFEKHEPPILSTRKFGRLHPNDLSRCETRSMGLVFDHHAYYFESQVAYKEKFYGYDQAAARWQKLQHHPGPWPVKLQDFLPWTDDRAQADLLHKPC